MAGIKVAGLPETLEELRRLGRLEDARAGIAAAALYVKGKLATYPPARHAPQPFKSDRQRRGFFAKLRSGEIDVPYRRGQSPGSERLGQAWVTVLRDLSAVVGNDTSYGPLVQQRSTQTAYHRATGWPTVEDVAEQEAEAVNAIIMRMYERAGQ